MNGQQQTNKEFFGNLLLISGNGRNVGKTYFACQIIKYLSKQHPVNALKISPHFHEITGNADVLIKNKDFIILNETKITHKDSSLFLQAGAVKVFFVMVKPESLEKAFYFIRPHLKDGPVVCESAILGEIVNAGLSFFLKKKDEQIVKNQTLAQNSQIIENDGQSLSFNFVRIGFENNQFFLKQKP